MSLSFQLPHPYAVEDRLTLDEREPTRWFDKFLLEIESSGLSSLLEDKQPLENSALLQLAQSRTKLAEDFWLVDHPKPDDGDSLTT